MKKATRLSGFFVANVIFSLDEKETKNQVKNMRHALF